MQVIFYNSTDYVMPNISGDQTHLEVTHHAIICPEKEDRCCGSKITPLVCSYIGSRENVRLQDKMYSQAWSNSGMLFFSGECWCWDKSKYSNIGLFTFICSLWSFFLEFKD